MTVDMNSRHMKIILLFFSILVLISSKLAAEEVRIAAAANFTATMKLLASSFEKNTGHKTRISYGSTGKLYTQIENGAPFDVFLAADSDRPIKAEQNGLAMKDSRFIYAFGKLLLCGKGKDLSINGEQWLKNNTYKRLAIANPKTAPYGHAARQILEQLGIWDDNQRKIVKGDSIAQTFQFVATRNADAGFIAASQIENWPDLKGKCWKVPSDYHSPLEQSVVLLNRGVANEAAQSFIDFIQQPEAMEIIHSYGYEI